MTSDPTLRWRFPFDATDESGRPAFLPTSTATVLASGGMVLSVERQSTQDSLQGPPLSDITLHAIDAATSDEALVDDVQRVSQGSPVIADGLVFVTVDPLDGILPPSGGTPDPNEQYDRTRGYVVAFDAATGVERWRTAGRTRRLPEPGLCRTGWSSSWTATATPTSSTARRVSSDGPVSMCRQGTRLDTAHSTPCRRRWRSRGVWSWSRVTPASPTPSGWTPGAVAWNWPRDTGNGVDDYGSGFQRKTIDPVISGDTVFLSTNRNNGTSVLAAIDLQTGQERWTRASQGSDPLPVAVDDGVAVLTVGPYNGRSLQAIDVATGQDVLWEVPVTGFDDPIPTIANGVVYIGSSDSSVRAIDVQTGDVLWTVRTGGAIASQIYAADGAVFFLSQDDWLYAVGGSDEPSGETASGSAVDISGLPACDVTPRPVVYATPIPDGTLEVPTVPLPSATPQSTLPNLSVGEPQTQAPAMRWDDLPGGTTVSAEQASGIAATLERMQTCSRPGNGAYLAAFYTDDYFLRPWVVWQTAYNGYATWGGPGGALDQNQILATGRVLPDGRVAVVQTSEWSPDYGTLVIFVEIDGQWLIDEWVELTRNGKPSQG